MSNEEILTDDYVAGLLSQEASDCSIKYSAMGVDAFLGKPSSSKKPANLPKPNTRFLRHIIKGTDSHNKALLAKEAAESKARLKKLERTEEIKRKKTNPTTKDIRERHMGDIQAILGGGRRRRRDKDADAETKDCDKRERSKAKRNHQPHKEDGRSGGETKDFQRRSRSSPDHKGDSAKHHSSRREDGRRSRHRNDSSDDDRRYHRHRSSRDGRSRSPLSGHRSKSTRGRDTERHGHRHRSPARHGSPATDEKKATMDDAQNEEIGPAPPPRIRGRGAVGASSGIDRRFSESYDPKMDIQGDDD
ncbi:hypothetical protein NLG97_g7105 [Lecanicillium saksenae]|uniref:Uncharacterized protein n=1 Tax=Lecanicillium saksenae TaxID=468837 RepID=A0ACC1QQ32_9HYPO|nr:hypothetical protein NLG97_g7105 [Lecanicillium saksenae]